MDDNILAQTVSIVSAYVSRHQLSAGDLPALIGSVYKSLANLGKEPKVEPAAAKAEPAVAIKKSVTPDYIICLEDGKKLKMLKRYLRSTYDMSPEEYRAKWGLPTDYPMVAPNYAKRRSELAKTIGLGTRGKGGAAVAAE
ncbi:MAG: MucR family transcriptional regulator [Azospirillaceae bacterium]|nr:MucR family transcriptional regulator [Azospirillaceae bacterium]